MKNIIIISMYQNFNYENNVFTNKYFKDFNFIKDRESQDIDIILCGSFINDNDYKYIKSKKAYKILWISEPIQHHFKNPYKLYLEKSVFHFYFGSIYNNIKSNHFKFPIYIDYYNSYDEPSVFENINKKFKISTLEKKYFCALICRHDRWKTRTNIYNSLQNIDHIICPSKLFNNYSNDEFNKIGKKKFLEDFIFNICPENTYTDLKGYITEKVMDACNSGCIPIYLEDIMDDIDKKIFNVNRILFYKNNKKSIQELKDKINSLYSNKKNLLDFYNQDIFLPNAYEEINNMEKNLKDAIKRIT